MARSKRRRGGTRPGRGRWRAPDPIGRDFAADQLNRKWYGDGTEIVTDEGKPYLDGVLDMGSRRLVGFALGEHHDVDLAYAALAMAVAVRGGRDAVTGVILATAQGSDYTAGSFASRLPAAGDPAVQGPARIGAGQRRHRVLAFHRRVRTAPPGALRRQAQARITVAAWIEEYNRDRRHSALQMTSPIGYELTLTAAAAAGQDNSRQAASPTSRPAPGRRASHRPHRGQGQALRVACGRP